MELQGIHNNQNNLEKEEHSWRTHTNIYSSIIHNSQRWKKKPKCPLIDEWINKIWYIHTMKYYFPIKRNEVVIRATT